MRNDQHWMTVAAALAIAAVAASPAAAQKKYDPGANDSEIKVGNIMPYSGPASAYGEIGKTQAAYFRKVNLSAMTTATARLRPSSKRASSSKAMRFC